MLSGSGFYSLPTCFNKNSNNSQAGFARPNLNCCSQSSSAKSGKQSRFAMQRINAVLGDACRRIGLRSGKNTKETSFSLKSLGLAGIPVADVKKEDSERAVAELLKIWEREQSLDVVLVISAKKGVKLKDRKGNLLLSYKMYDIANCAVHKEFPDVFVFMARQCDSTYCHAFYCSDVLQAEAICLTMSEAFQTAFAAWMKQAQEKKAKKEMTDDMKDEETGKQPKTSLDENCNPILRKTSKGRRPSLMSNTSAFSFNSDADQAFQSLISVQEEEEMEAVLLRRDSMNWDEIKEDENVQVLMLGEEVQWDTQTDC